MFATTLLAACGDGTPVDPATPPQITILGVEDGRVYEDPVEIEIEVDRGSLSAALDGAPFYSGTTVSALGAHTLEVSARAGGVETVERVEFEIVFTGERVLILRMLNLGPQVPWGGGGDAILLTDSSAAAMAHGLVDAGPGGFQEGTVDYDLVANRLGGLGVDTLQFLQLTHAHADHYAGVQTVLDSVHVRRFIYNGQRRTQAGYTNTLARAEQRADSVFVLTNEWEFALGTGEDATRTVHIHGLSDHLEEDTDDSRMLNEGSLGTFVEQGGLRIFLTGDGERRSNDRWRTHFDRYTSNVDILKAGHHGANNAIFDSGISGSSTWLEHTDPGIVLITANGRTHPRHNALTKIEDRTNTRTYCTPVHGDIELRISSDGKVNVTTQRSAADDCVAGSEATT